MTFQSIFGYVRECLVKQTFISEIIEHLMETYVLIDGYLFIMELVRYSCSFFAKK